MYCHHCGNQLEDGARFCTYCGGPLPPAGQYPPPSKKGMQTSTIVLLTLGIILFCVVIGLVQLGTVLFPAIKGARGAAQHMQCVNNLRVMALALHNYHDANQTFPPAYTVDKNGNRLHSWRVLILPYTGEFSQLYKCLRLGEPWDSEHNRQYHDKMPFFYHCPGAPPEQMLKGETNYSGIIGKDAFFSGSKGRGMGELTTGTHNVIMIVEQKKGSCWMDPRNDMPLEVALQGINKTEDGPGSYHFGRIENSNSVGINVAVADGSVRFVKDTDPLENWKKQLYIKEIKE